MHPCIGHHPIHMAKSSHSEVNHDVKHDTDPSMPRFNELAPAFDAPTTHGRKTLEDYRGQWLVLFSRPADFTPVCTTEFIAFAKRHADFQALGCELLGLSIDSHYSHIAWERNIEEKFGVEIGFPTDLPARILLISIENIGKSPAGLLFVRM